MQTITIDKDISLCCVTATSFPEGIAAAHEKLHSIVPAVDGRRYFGISRPEHGPIVYWAAAEEIETGEAKKLHLETMALRKGRYISLIINDYLKDITSVKKAFDKLLAQPDLDPNGYCVEWYLNNKEVQCMIRLAN